VIRVTGALPPDQVLRAARELLNDLG